MEKLLLVEDDPAIVGHLRELLYAEGYFVVCAAGQTEAMNRLEEEAFDLLILDIALADGNGFSICAVVKSSYDIPVIFLTASGDEYSVVAGLEMGADDYVSKPFRSRELLSRIRAVLRRRNRRTQFFAGPLRVDAEQGKVYRDGQELFLSAMEYRLLLIFLNNKGKIISRDGLIEEIWNAAGEYINDNTLTVYIKRLRDKIETDPRRPELICTVRGLGYRMG